MSKTLNEAVNDFIQSMDALTEAHEATNESIIDELIDEIEAHNLIKTDSPLEVQLDLENLREWLKMYYTVGKQ